MYVDVRVRLLSLPSPLALEGSDLALWASLRCA